MNGQGEEMIGTAPRTDALASTWAPEVLPFVEQPALKGRSERHFQPSGSEFVRAYYDKLSPGIKVLAESLKDTPQYIEGFREERVVQSWILPSDSNKEAHTTRNDYFYDGNGRLVCIRIVKETPIPLSEFGDQSDPRVSEELLRFELYRYNEDGKKFAGATVRKKGEPVNYGRERYTEEEIVSQVFLPNPMYNANFSASISLT